MTEDYQYEVTKNNNIVLSNMFGSWSQFCALLFLCLVLYLLYLSSVFIHHFAFKPFPVLFCSYIKPNLQKNNIFILYCMHGLQIDDVLALAAFV